MKRFLVAALSLFSLPAFAAQDQGCGITPYGVGLGGANTGNLYSNSVPTPGSTLAFEMDSFTPDPSFGPGFGLLLVSDSDLEVPLFGGTLLVDPTSLLDSKVVFYDIYAISFVSVPNDNDLIGFTGYVQSGLLFSQSIGWAFSNGLEVTICP